MAKKIIEFKLGADEIGRAIQELEAYKASLKAKKDLILSKLGYIGVKEASVRFTTAMYDGVNDSNVTLTPIPNGYAIVAKGQAVAFIEFGTGVYHNGGEPYPKPRPSGISPIGGYGQGKGKRRAWFYKGSPGSSGELQTNGVVKTRGNPAAMPMWYASEDMRKAVLKIAREVFR